MLLLTVVIDLLLAQVHNHLVDHRGHLGEVNLLIVQGQDHGVNTQAAVYRSLDDGDRLRVHDDKTRSATPS
eukprot:6535840-Heterocapsa_arctica.AAC.1